MLSCGSKTFDSKEQLLQYMMDEDNGYHYKKSINGIDYTLTYRPTDLLVQQELGSEYTEEQVAELRKKYGKYLYFNLSMSVNGQELLNQKAGDRAQFGAMVNQLAFGMEDKVNLITSKRDTLSLLDYAYPRMYGMGTSTDILLVYDRNEKLWNKENLRFTVADMGFGTGEVAFNLGSKQLMDQPKLKFKDAN